MITDRHAWSRPERETVAPGVHRLPLPLPFDALRAVNVYALVADGELTLVDGGWALAESRDLLRGMLGELGADLGDIDRFLVTHMHRDHYSQAAALRRDVGGVVALGAGERESLATVRSREEPLGAQVRGLVVAGADELADVIRAWVAGTTERETVADYADPDEWLVDGQRLAAGGRALTARETPGHTRGHLVFAEEPAPDTRPLLFAGDHVLPHITPSIGFEPAAVPGALGRFLTSLALLRGEEDRTLLPAHGPTAPSTHARIDELLAHHDTRLAEIEAAVRAGAPTAAEVATVLRWTRREHRLEDMEAMHRMLAVLETDAHLEVLAAQGRVVRTSEPRADGAVVATHVVR